MVPVECVVRNVCAGSMAKRYGIAEGTRLAEPIFEFFLKSDALHDPLVNDDHIRDPRLGERGRDRADEGADAQGQRGARAAVRRRRHRSRRLQAGVRPPDRGPARTAGARRRVHARRLPAVGRRRPARRWTRTASAAISAASSSTTARSPAGSARRCNAAVARVERSETRWLWQWPRVSLPLNPGYADAGSCDRQSPSVVPVSSPSRIAQISSKRRLSACAARGCSMPSAARGRST